MFRVVGETSIRFMALRRLGYVVTLVLLTASVGAMLWRETRASWRRLLLFVLSIAAG